MEPGGCPSVLAAARDGGTRPHANAAKIIENGRRLSQVPDDDDETKLLGCFLRADFGRANGLGAMLVSPRARGRGLGKALMAAALDATPADRAACPVILASCSPMGQPMYVRRADSSLTNRGDDAVAATWIFRGDGVAATPRRRRGRSVETGALLQIRRPGPRDGDYCRLYGVLQRLRPLQVPRLRKVRAADGPGGGVGVAGRV